MSPEPLLVHGLVLRVQARPVKSPFVLARKVARPLACLGGVAVYRFGEFELDEARFELRRAGEPVRVQRLVLETILFFVRSGDRLVTRQELIRGPWQGARVGDAAVSRAVLLARKALSDASASLIATVHGRGYRFLADVSKVSAAAVDPSPDGTGSATGPCLAPVAGWALAALHAAFQEARRGRGRLVVVSGEARAGKTTLVEHFGRQVERDGTLVAWGRAWDRSSAPPLWPWPEILRSCSSGLARASAHCGTEPTGSEQAQLLAQMADLSMQTSHGHERGQNPDGSIRIFDSVARSLTELATYRSAVVVLEDMHHAGDACVRLLEFLRQRIGRSSLLIVATCLARQLRLDETARHVTTIALCECGSGMPAAATGA